MNKQEIIRNSMYLGDKAIQVYQSYIAQYKRNEKFFLMEDFTFPIAQKLLTMAILSAWDLYHLFYYAKRIPAGGTYLEIGGYVGGSLRCAYMATRLSGASVNFITIEPFLMPLVNKEKGITAETQFHKNTKGIPHTLIKSTSDMAKDKIPDNSVDLLFIDGSHEHQQIRKDIRNYWPKLKSDRVLLGHDYQKAFPGVRHAVYWAFGEGGYRVLKNSSMWRVIKGMNIQAAKQNLSEIKQILDSLKVKFWLDTGTLLGAIRKKNFLPLDHDIDLRMLAKDWYSSGPLIQRKAKAKGFGCGVEIVYDNKVSVAWFDKRGIRVDIGLEYYYPPDDVYISLPRGAFVNNAITPARFYREDYLISFLGEYFRVPYPPEEKLERLYGKNWRIPTRTGWKNHRIPISLEKYLKWLREHPKEEWLK